jgi:hypothetical protein
MLFHPRECLFIIAPDIECGTVDRANDDPGPLLARPVTGEYSIDDLCHTSGQRKQPLARYPGGLIGGALKILGGGAARALDAGDLPFGSDCRWTQQTKDVDQVHR